MEPAKTKGNFHAIFQHSIIPILVVDGQGRIALANQSTVKLFGYSLDELVGHQLEKLLPEDVCNKHIHHRQVFFSAPRSRPMGAGMDLKGRKKDGTVFPLEIGLAYYTEDAETYAVAFIRDITERTAWKDKFSKVFYSSPAAISLSETDSGKMIEVNEHFCRMVGYSKEEILGKTSVEANILTSEQREMLNSMLRRDGRISKLELPIRTKADETLHVMLSGEILEILGKEYYLATSFDITQNKKDQQERIQLNARYQGVFANSLVAIIVSDVKTYEILDANDTALEMLGYRTREEFVRDYDLKNHNLILPEGANGPATLSKDQAGKDGVIATTKSDGTTLYVKRFSKIIPGTSIRVTVAMDVTHEILQFEKLRESQEQLRLLYKGIREVFILAQPLVDETGQAYDYRFLEVSPQSESLIGKAPWELTGRLSSEILGPLDTEMKEAITRVITDREAMMVEQYDQARDKWLEIHLYPSEGGQIATLTLDITARKKIEVKFRDQTEALRKSEERYRLMFLNMRETFVEMEPLIDENGKFIDARITGVNPAAERIIGKTGEELVGQLRSLVIGPFDDSRRDRYTDLLKRKGILAEEIYYPHSSSWIEAHSFIQDGKIICIGFDITERKAAEGRREGELGWLVLLNQAMSRLWKINNMHEGLEEILSTSIKLLNADKGAIHLLHPKKSVLTIVAHKGLQDDFLYRFREVGVEDGFLSAIAFAGRKQVAINDVQNEPAFRGFREVFRNEECHAVQATVLYNEEGEPIGVISTYSHVLDHLTQEFLKRMELYAHYAETFLSRLRNIQQIQQINAELEQRVSERTLELLHMLEHEKELNEAKSRFVSLASHEFRTPLSAMLSSVSLLEYYQGAEQEPMRAKYLKRIRHSIHNMMGILNDYLALDTLELGKVSVHPEEFDLAELVEDIVDEMETQVKRKRQKISFDRDEKVVVFQDKNIMRSILTNLLSNASKYSPEETEIFLVMKQTISRVIISVKDQGIGIPAADRRNIFSKFFRAGNVGVVQGTGLGLNIVHRYIEMLQGKIDFKCGDQGGTTFFVQLPRKFGKGRTANDEPPG